MPEGVDVVGVCVWWVFSKTIVVAVEMRWPTSVSTQQKSNGEESVSLFTNLLAIALLLLRSLYPHIVSPAGGNVSGFLQNLFIEHWE